LTGAGVPPEKLTDAFTLIDKVERLSGDQLRAVREGKEGGFSPTVAARLLEIAGLRGWPAVESALAETTGGLVVGELLRSVASALKAMGLESFVEIDLTIVRGLAYYTGTVFELFDARGELRAICGGGRYDNLVGALGGVDLPCVGFGMGDVVLGELLKGRGLVPEMPSSIDVFVVGIEGADLEHVLRIAHELRRAGVRVEYGLNAQPIAKQLRLADARRARFALVMGGDERARGEVTLKDLATKTQRLVARDAIVAELTRAIEQ
jgi:histidyl-tRNA synthetase